MVKNKKTIQFIGVDCILMVILTLLDQWTKSLVVHHLKDQSDIILIPGIFRLHYLENRGAAFGILQNQRIVFVILTIIYLAAVFWFSLINFPVINVADIFVVISFIGIAVSILFIYKDDEFEFLSIRKKESKA